MFGLGRRLDAVSAAGWPENGDLGGAFAMMSLIQVKAAVETLRSRSGVMTPELVRKYAQPVPRYTSYPTAPHFHVAVGHAAASAWLAALSPALPLSLYLHIPFCRSLCWFCGCHTRIARHDAPLARYLAQVRDEIALVAAILGGRRTLSHVHLGGGSPSLLRPDDLRRLAETLHRHFAIAPAAEFAVEIDPRTMDSERAAALAEIGVNRVSLGVQDFNPAVQQEINRVQPFGVTALVVGLLRGYGIGQISIDLMYGLPLQTETSIADTVGKTVALEPERVALFGYAHVPWLKKHQRLIDEASLPGAWQRWCQAQTAARALANAGYVAIGLDHFAWPEDPLACAAAGGQLRRNFQGYTTDRAGALIGVGTSAIGMLPAGYVQNGVELKHYGAALAAGQLPIARGYAFAPEDRLRAAVIERLMCDLSVDVGATCRATGFSVDHLDAALERVAGLAPDGLAVVDARRVSIPDAARLFMRNVAACFDAFLEPAEPLRHARAV
jgi:oxygen-independent coproporphyrinogen-3 oxidase